MSKPYHAALMPGVNLTAIQTGKFKSNYWSLLLVMPLRQETAAFHAVLPRVLCRGTATCPSREKLEDVCIALYGAPVRPVVKKLGEAHCFGFTSTFLEDGLAPDGQGRLHREAQLLGDLLLHPATRSGRLLQPSVDTEREALLLALQRERQNRQRYARDRLTARMCRGEAFQVGRLGDLRTARRVTVIRLNQYYQKLLAEAHVEAYYCGSASPEQAEQAWKEALMGLPRRGAPELPVTVVQREAAPVRHDTEALDGMPERLAMGLRTNLSMTSLDFPALLILHSLLEELICSGLAMRDRALRARVSLEPHKGILYVEVGGACQAQAEDAVLTLLDAVCQGDFPSKELEAARRVVLSRLCAVLDDQFRQADYWLNQRVAGQRLPPELLAALVTETTKEQVVSAARHLALDTVYTLTEGKEAAS